MWYYGPMKLKPALNTFQKEKKSLQMLDLRYMVLVTGLFTTRRKSYLTFPAGKKRLNSTKSIFVISEKQASPILPMHTWAMVSGVQSGKPHVQAHQQGLLI